MNNKAKAINASQTIFANCLALPPSAKLVIFADETTRDVADILGETAVQMGLWPLTVYYTKQMQIELGEHVPEDHWDFLSTAAAVMVCLNASEQGFPFRDHVRKAAWQSGCKVAHMPGIALDILQLAEVDYSVLQANCEILALALAKGRHIRVETVDSHGRKYHLETDLDPWRRMPIISDGIIQTGSWGNVPSGETFIAPPENQTSGEIVIDGSIPGCIISHGNEIVLSFNDGRLVDWQPRDVPAARQLEQIAVRYAQENNDVCWDVLAEIGLGVNPMVKNVTGNALLDEKKFGSLHIALGDNMDMGGSNESSIHCDMISLRPRVEIDGLTILSDGDLTVSPTDWREDYRRLSPPQNWDNNMILRPTAIDTEVDAKSLLRRIWHTGSGRVCSVPVGDDESAKLAHALYKRLKRNGKSESIGRITHSFSSLPAEDVLKLIYLLKRYNLVSVNGLREANGNGDEI
jgi:leucyl aminopeptidase (aminopeptidase T)